MRDSLKLQNYKITKLRNLQHRQRGYMMITLMLAMALVMIGLLAVLPDIKQQAQRDREEELRHRGTAYMRAIQRFYKKFGRYPSRIEELENTNNQRFLRKRYTDPMTRDPKTGKEKDFKLLHQQDVMLNSGPVLPLLNAPGRPGGVAGGATQAGLGALAAQAGGLQQTGGVGSQTSVNGDSDNSSSGSSSSGNSGSGNSGSGNSVASGNSNSFGSSSSNSNGGSSSGFNGPTFGGGPILGVASTSKAKTIRVFADKTHYNEWLFIYVQQFDRGGLLVGPVNPNQPPVGPTVGGIPLPPGGLSPGTMPNGGMTQGFPQPQQNSNPMPPQQ
jgi:type II secretory pathway pseudopilin PulG